MKIISGSRARRVLNCTASVRLASRIGEPSASPEAIEGTAIHTVLAKMLVGEMPSCVGQEIMTKDSDIPVLITERMARDKIEPMLRATKGLLEMFRVGDDYAVEEYFDVGHLLSGCDGTADIIARSHNGIALIIDWKSGFVQVNAKDNEQLLWYAACALKSGHEYTLDAEEMVLAILQPEEGPEGPQCMTRIWTVGREEVEQFWALCEERHRTIYEGETAYKAGDWCTFCPGKAVCPEHAKSLGALANHMPELERGLSPIGIANLFRAAEKAEEQVKTVEKFKRLLAEQGRNDIPGYKIVESLGNRKYPSQNAAINTLAPILGDGVYEKKLASPAEHARRLKKLGYATDVVDSLVIRESKLKLVRDTDDRPTADGGEIHDMKPERLKMEMK